MKEREVGDGASRRRWGGEETKPKKEMTRRGLGGGISKGQGSPGGPPPERECGELLTVSPAGGSGSGRTGTPRQGGRRRGGEKKEAGGDQVQGGVV